MLCHKLKCLTVLYGDFFIIFYEGCGIISETVLFSFFFFFFYSQPLEQAVKNKILTEYQKYNATYWKRDGQMEKDSWRETEWEDTERNI